jgi:predicted RND superfamily exporter protein
VKRFAQLVDQYRVIILIGILLITAFFAYQLQYLKVYTSFEDLLPQNHPFIKVHNQIRENFGGANQVLIMVQVREGDIFNRETLGKVKAISKRLRTTPGVDPNKIRSIAVRKMKYARISSGRMRMENLMFPNIPETGEEMAYLKEKIYSSPRYYGPFVSLDSKKTLITVDFFEERLDFKAIFEDLSKIREEMEDDNHIINIAGEPMHLGFIRYHNRDVIRILIITVVAIMIILYGYFRSVQGVVIPLLSGVVSGIWGLGIMALIGFNLDPLILVLPFLIALMTARHGMQKLVRYTEEYLKVGDGRTAARNVIVAMFTAGITGILTDSFGIALVALAAIPILQEISIVCVLWTIPTLIIALIFTPLLLSFTPVSRRLIAQFERRKENREKETGRSDRALAWLGRGIVGRGKWYVVTATVIIVAIGMVYSRNIEVGDFYPGSSILWPDHRYNKDALRITYSMPLLNPLYVILQGATKVDGKDSEWYLANGEVIREIDRFQQYMGRNRRVMFTQSIVNQMPGILMGMRDADPNWNFFPHEDEELIYFLKMLIFRARPGTYEQFADTKMNGANIIVYCRDKMPETVRSVIKDVRDYVEKVSLKDGAYLLAGGAIGVQAAVREEIHAAQIWNLTLALLGLFLFCTVNFRSVTAGLILTIPLAISNIITVALMAAYQIGLTVNTYPISSIGIGLGVDYGIYFVGRLLEEKQVSPDLNTAIINTIKSNGKAIIIIATTLTVGLVSWLLSPLKFQAEMGALFALLLFLNMLGAILLVPSLIAILKPRFARK